MRSPKSKAFSISFRRRIRFRRSQRGFTVLELLVVLAILAIITSLSIPALLNTMRRSKIEGPVREVATLMRRARLEAIKRNRQTMVFADQAKEEITAFVDLDEDRVQDPGEDVLARITLPYPIELRGAGSGTDLLAIDDFNIPGFGPAPGPVFEPDGSVLAQGAIRIADDRNNALEIRVMSSATGRVEIRKWLDDTMDMASDPLANPGPTGTGADWYAKGDSGRGWVWN